MDEDKWIVIISMHDGNKRAVICAESEALECARFGSFAEAEAYVDKFVQIPEWAELHKVWIFDVDNGQAVLT